MSSADDTTSGGDRNPVTDFPVQPDVAALYDRYGDAMYQSARKVLALHSMESDAGDAVGNVIKNLLQAHSKGQLEHKREWEPYLRKACRNEALNIVKKRLETSSLEELDDTNASSMHFLDRTQGLDPVSDEVAQQAEQREAGAAVARARLTHRQADVVFSYFTEGKTDEEISVELGITRTSVSKTRRTAQSKIAQVLQGGDSG